MSVKGGLNQRGRAVAPSGIDLGPLGEQRLHHIKVAVLGSQYQRSRATDTFTWALTSAPGE